MLQVRNLRSRHKRWLPDWKPWETDCAHKLSEPRGDGDPALRDNRSTGHSERLDAPAPYCGGKRWLRAEHELSNLERPRRFAQRELG